MCVGSRLEVHKLDRLRAARVTLSPTSIIEKGKEIHATESTTQRTEKAHGDNLVTGQES